MLENRLTYANAVSTLALVVALTGGTAYAVNTVRSADIVDGEVKQADLASNSVTGAKVKNNILGAEDIGEKAVGTSELDTDAVGAAELSLGTLPEFTYQESASTPTDANATKELVVTCDNTGQSDVIGGGYVASPNFTGLTVHRSYAVSANSWLVRATAPAGVQWQLTVVATCVA